MRKIAFFLGALLLTSGSVFSQSASFTMLKNNFEDSEEVHVFSIDGFFCRTLFSLVEDDEFKDAVKNINSFDLITIPNSVFATSGNTRRGFRKLLEKDNFESLLTAKENDDNVEIFYQHNGNRRDRYLVWKEDTHGITAIEIDGKIDVKKLLKQTKTLAEQSN